MDEDLKYPHVTPELIRYLERIYPDECPTMSMSKRQIWMAVGAAELIRHLKALNEEQLEKALSSNV